MRGASSYLVLSRAFPESFCVHGDQGCKLSSERHVRMRPPSASAGSAARRIAFPSPSNRNAGVEADCPRLFGWLGPRAAKNARRGARDDLAHLAKQEKAGRLSQDLRPTARVFEAPCARETVQIRGARAYATVVRSGRSSPSRKGPLRPSSVRNWSCQDITMMRGCVRRLRPSEKRCSGVPQFQSSFPTDADSPR